LADPELTVGARGAHEMAQASSAARTQAAWVDVGSLHQNRDVPLPYPVRDRLFDRADRIVEAAITADSASTALRQERPRSPEPALASGRHHQEREIPKGTSPQPGIGCER